MRGRVVSILVVALLAVGAGAGWWWHAQTQAAEARLLRASGMLEATETRLASEYGGRLIARPAREGSPVRRGAELAMFDTEILDHQLQAAMASDPTTYLQLEHQRERQTLRAPRDGWVVRTVYEQGELVPAGATVVVVADWRELTLKVYLPEHQFGRVMLGQPGRIAVDAYPSVAFVGEVTFIAAEAEFTPRNVQTREDRVKTVYAIKLRVPNDDLRLKPGMFADVVFDRDAGEPPR